MLYVVRAKGWGGLKGCFRFNMRVCQPPITRPPPNKRALSLPFPPPRRAADVAGPLTEELSSLNYSNIEVLGGGRILLDSSLKKLVVYGYSYGFGMADHAVTVGAIIQTGEYEGYDIEHNNEGY